MRIRSNLLYSIVAQFCFAGLSITLNTYALAFMETDQALAFILIFAVAQSYVPVHNSSINLTLASLSPRMSNARRKGYGVLTLGWSARLALLHASLIMGVFLVIPMGGITIALALFGYCLISALVNFMRHWLIQSGAFRTVLIIDGSVLIIVISVMLFFYLFFGRLEIEPALLLSIGTFARFTILIAYRSYLPSGTMMSMRLARGFRMLHLQKWRKLILLSFANYMRQGLIYILLTYTLSSVGILLLRAADLLIMPLRQISSGAISFLVLIISRGSTSSRISFTTFLVAGSFGIFVAGIYLFLRWSGIGTILPDRFFSVIEGTGGLLLAIAFFTHLMSAAVVGLLRGAFDFYQLARSSIFANLIGVVVVLTMTYFTGDWRWGLAGFIGIDIVFLLLFYKNKNYF